MASGSGKGWPTPVSYTHLEDGYYTLKEGFRLPLSIAGETPPPRFVVTGEISNIYKKNGRTRKVHNLILLPSLEAADTLSRRLEAIGNIHSDGRPILGPVSYTHLRKPTGQRCFPPGAPSPQG